MRTHLILGKVSAMVMVAMVAWLSLVGSTAAQTPAATGTTGPMGGTPAATGTAGPISGTPTPSRSPMGAPPGTGTPAPMMGTPMAPATATPDARFNQQVMQSLQSGGYVIYFRHGATDRAQQDTDANNLANCATQRNLNEQGRGQARAIGDAFRAHNIPVGQVLSSEYCRALEFARLAFGKAQAEPSLVLPDPLPAATQQQNTTALQPLLNASPAAGTNTVMVSHSPNLRSAIGLDLTVEGSAAILKPSGQGGQPTVVAVVLPNQWSTQAAQTGPNPVPSEMPRTGAGGESMWQWSLPAILLGLLVALGAWRLLALPGAKQE